MRLLCRSSGQRSPPLDSSFADRVNRAGYDVSFTSKLTLLDGRMLISKLTDS